MNIKIIPVLLLAACSSCGTKNDTKVIVTRNREELRIRVNISRNWHTTVNYDRRFPSATLNQRQQDSLVTHIVDSVTRRPPKD